MKQLINKILIFKLIIAIIFLFNTLNLQAQEYSRENSQQEEGKLIDKLVFGGNLGLLFGSTTLIDISPTVGYRVKSPFIVGAGATYIYYSDEYYSTYIYGGKLFASYDIFKSVFATCEFELLNWEYYNLASSETERVWVEGYLVGLGYYQQLGERSRVSITVLWNLNETSKSLYKNPIIRVGFNL